MPSENRRMPLSVEIMNDQTLEGVRQRRRGKGQKKEAARLPSFESKVPAKLTTKIFQQARAQLAEDADDAEDQLALSSSLPASSSSRTPFSSSRSSLDEGDDDDDAKLFAEFSDRKSVV